MPANVQTKVAFNLSRVTEYRGSLQVIYPFEPKQSLVGSLR